MRRAGAATRSGARQVLHHKSRKRNAGEPWPPLPAFFAENRANQSALLPGKAARQGVLAAAFCLRACAPQKRFRPRAAPYGKGRAGKAIVKGAGGFSAASGRGAESGKQALTKGREACKIRWKCLFESGAAMRFGAGSASRCAEDGGCAYEQSGDRRDLQACLAL